MAELSPRSYRWSCEALRSDRFTWPCDSGSLRSAASSLERTPLSPRILGILVRKPAMSADPHGPSPKGLLCNAGAGAAAGASDFFSRSVFVWFPKKVEESNNERMWKFSVLLGQNVESLNFSFCCLFSVWKILGFGAGVIAATFVCPLDVIKTRLQVHGLPQLGNGTIKGMPFFAFGLLLRIKITITFGGITWLIFSLLFF